MAFNSLRDALPAKNENISTDDLLSRFLDWVETRKITLYEAQENAILELFDGKNVILNTPTGSGKSLVALA
ncbi:MAG: DEAD/DEAH box helicase, partial [Fibrobacteraceae bacterium]